MRFGPAMGFPLAAFRALKTARDFKKRRCWIDGSLGRPVASGNEHVVATGIAPQPKALTQRFDRKRGYAPPGMAFGCRMPVHEPMVIQRTQDLKNDSEALRLIKFRPDTCQTQ